MWKFRAMKAHQGPLLPTDPDYNGSRYIVQVELETGEITYEPLSIISRDYPVTCAVYAKEHGLLNEPRWKNLKKYVKSQKTMVRSIKQSKIRQVRKATKYKFGYQVPRDYNEAMSLAQQNGNKQWRDAISTEIEQMDEYEVFKDMGKAI